MSDFWIQLNESIFHPKGGGQPSDEGTINGITVQFVFKELLNKTQIDKFNILHCFNENENTQFKEGDEVELKVDGNKRYLHSKLHSGGHALADVVQKRFPALEGYQGNHAPNDSYVKFKMLSTDTFDKQKIKDQVQLEFQSWINESIPVSVVENSAGLRAIQVGENKPVPCGGTHIKNLNELKSVIIPDVSVNNKEKTVTVKYRISE